MNRMQARRLPACEMGEGAAFPCLSAERDVIVDSSQLAAAGGAAEDSVSSPAGDRLGEALDGADVPEDAPAEDSAASEGDETAPGRLQQLRDAAAPEAADSGTEGAAVDEGGETATVGRLRERLRGGEAQPEAQADAVPEAPVTEETAETAAPAAEAAETADETAESAAPAEETTAPRRETLRERLAGASAAAAASEETAEDASVEVEETTVTEADTRRASEEFERSVSSGTEEAQAPRAEAEDGLSTFEKALLLGLGAVAVGQILDSGERIVSNTGDRVVVQRGDEYRVLKDDDTLLRQPGSDVRTERFSDGSTRETVIQSDGRKIVTIRAADGRVLRRVRVFEDGTQVVLFDDTQTYAPVDVTELPPPAEETISLRDSAGDDALRAAIEAELARDLGRSFSLAQVREIRAVRELVPTIDVEAITFALGSAAIRPEEARELADLGLALRELIDERPGEVFLIEGHTDATGSAALNLALSDRRAETVALALTEYFDVPPENLVVQGYGESALKIETEAAEEANRRVVVRRITPLLGERRLAQEF